MKYSNTVDCALESTLPISGKLTPFIRHSKAIRIFSVRLSKKEQNSKNADCGFTGRFAKLFSGERPDPLGFELPFLSELK